MNDSFGLQVFQRGWKDLPTPLVVVDDFHPSRKSGGYYASPYRCEVLLDRGVYVPRDRGVIVLPRDAEDPTMAHEWRHHWQNYYVKPWDKYTRKEAERNENILANNEYWRATELYFTTIPTEYDALRYSIKQCPNQGSEPQWIDAIPALQHLVTGKRTWFVD